MFYSQTDGVTITYESRTSLPVYESSFHQHHDTRTSKPKGLEKMSKLRVHATKPALVLSTPLVFFLTRERVHVHSSSQSATSEEAAAAARNRASHATALPRRSGVRSRPPETIFSS